MEVDHVLPGEHKVDGVPGEDILEERENDVECKPRVRLRHRAPPKGWRGGLTWNVLALQS